MDGGLTPNSALDAFHVVAALEAPEDIALAEPGSLFVTAGNQLLHVDLASGGSQVVATFGGKATGLAAAPSGLLVCVSGEGLVRVARNGSTTTLLAAGDAPGAGHLTSVAVRGEEIFVTSASEQHAPEAWARDLFAGGHSGRLLRVKGQGRAEVLLDGLAWPYGLCVSGDELVISESWAHRLLAYSPTTGKRRVLRDRLPAYPARLTGAPSGNLWVAMFAPRSYLVDFVLREDAYRDAMMTDIAEDEWIRPSLRTTNAVREPLQLGRARHLGEVKPWAPSRSYGLVAEMTPEGEFLGSYHSRANGDRHGTTAALQLGDELAVVSAGVDSILVGPLAKTEALA
jgi:hypothetical protein